MNAKIEHPLPIAAELVVGCPAQGWGPAPVAKPFLKRVPSERLRVDGWEQFPLYNAARSGNWYDFGFLLGTGFPLLGAARGRSRGNR